MIAQISTSESWILIFLLKTDSSCSLVKYECSWQTLYSLQNITADLYCRKVTATEQYTNHLWNQEFCLDGTLHDLETGNRKKQQEEVERNRKQFLSGSQVKKPASSSVHQRFGRTQPCDQCKLARTVTGAWVTWGHSCYTTVLTSKF